MTKPNEQYRSDLLYAPHDALERSTFRYILAGVDAASRHSVTRVLRTKKASEFSFVLEVIFKMGGVFKYPRVY